MVHGYGSSMVALQLRALGLKLGQDQGSRVVVEHKDGTRELLLVL